MVKTLPVTIGYSWGSHLIFGLGPHQWCHLCTAKKEIIELFYILLNQYCILEILVSLLYFLGWIGTELHVMLNYNYRGQNVIVMLVSYFPWIQMWKYVIIISQTSKATCIISFTIHYVLLYINIHVIHVMGLHCWHTLF